MQFILKIKNNTTKATSQYIQKRNLTQFTVTNDNTIQIVDQVMTHSIMSSKLTFNKIITTNHQLFQYLKQRITPSSSLMQNGANFNLLLYGLSGTGKTHTIFNTQPTPDGLIYLLCKQLLASQPQHLITLTFDIPQLNAFSFISSNNLTQLHQFIFKQSNKRYTQKTDLNAASSRQNLLISLVFQKLKINIIDYCGYQQEAQQNNKKQQKGLSNNQIRLNFQALNQYLKQFRNNNNYGIKTAIKKLNTRYNKNNNILQKINQNFTNSTKIFLITTCEGHGLNITIKHCLKSLMNPHKIKSTKSNYSNQSINSSNNTNNQVNNNNNINQIEQNHIKDQIGQNKNRDKIVQDLRQQNYKLKDQVRKLTIQNRFLKIDKETDQIQRQQAQKIHKLYQQKIEQLNKKINQNENIDLSKFLKIQQQIIYELNQQLQNLRYQLNRKNELIETQFKNYQKQMNAFHNKLKETEPILRRTIDRYYERIIILNQVIENYERDAFRQTQEVQPEFIIPTNQPTINQFKTNVKQFKTQRKQRLFSTIQSSSKSKSSYKSSQSNKKMNQVTIQHLRERIPIFIDQRKRKQQNRILTPQQELKNKKIKIVILFFLKNDETDQYSFFIWLNQQKQKLKDKQNLKEQNIVPKMEIQGQELIQQDVDFDVIFETNDFKNYKSLISKTKINKQQQKIIMQEKMQEIEDEEVKKLIKSQQLPQYQKHYQV